MTITTDLEWARLCCRLHGEVLRSALLAVACWCARCAGGLR